MGSECFTNEEIFELREILPHRDRHSSKYKNSPAGGTISSVLLDEEAEGERAKQVAYILV